jgi:riboflavin biosynthesis pyrimidine reductase
MRTMSPAAGDELDDAGLAELYAYPEPRWLRANMVTSADGAGFLDGRTEGLSSPADMRLFGLLRVLADVVLVGAGTARTEQYKPARRRPALAALRAGRPPVPPIAVLSRKLDLDFATPLFNEAPQDARTIVITCAGSPDGRRAAAAKVADVIVAGDLVVDLTEALSALRARGLGRVLCEGGPHLLGEIAAAGLLDELCLTVSPVLAGPGPGRITAGAPFPEQLMTLEHVLEDDGFLYCRYLVDNRLPARAAPGLPVAAAPRPAPPRSARATSANRETQLVNRYLSV